MRNLQEHIIDIFKFFVSILKKNFILLKHILPGPPFLFGAVLALIAIFVTWVIPSKNKNSVLISQRNNKERTVVKIGNTSATYNRTSSSSSLTLNNPNLLSPNAIASTSAASASQEQEQLLLDDSHTNILQLSSNLTASMAVPSSLATSTQSNVLQNSNQEMSSLSNFNEGKNN